MSFLLFLPGPGRVSLAAKTSGYTPVALILILRYRRWWYSDDCTGLSESLATPLGVTTVMEVACIIPIPIESGPGARQDGPIDAVLGCLWQGTVQALSTDTAQLFLLPNQDGPAIVPYPYRDSYSKHLFEKPLRVYTFGITWKGATRSEHLIAHAISMIERTTTKPLYLIG